MRYPRAFALIFLPEYSDRERIRNIVQRFDGGNGYLGGVDPIAVIVFQA